MRFPHLAFLLLASTAMAQAPVPAPGAAAPLTMPDAIIARIEGEPVRLSDVLATAADGQYDLWQDNPPHAAVWMLGSERDGLAPELRREATATVAIRGTGAVESLNVAAATALVLGASWRAHGDLQP